MVSPLRVVHTITWDPIEIAGGTTVSDNGTTLYLHGIGVSTFQDVFEALNVSVSYSYTDFQSAMKMVANNTADLGTLTISHTSDWAKLGIGSKVTYLHPLTREPSTVFFRQPPSSNLRNTMLRPFKTESWVALGLTFFLISVITLTVNQNENILKSLGISVLNAIELGLARPPIYQILDKQSNFKSVVQICAVYLSVFVTSLYTAKVVSVFVLKDELIKNPEDLLKHKYTLFSYSSLHLDRLFGNNKTRKLVDGLVHPVSGLETIEKVVGKNVEDPRQAILTLADGFYPQALFQLGYTREVCQISKFESKLKTPRCAYIRKNSTFRNPINIKILQLIERGLNFRLRKQHYAKFLYVCPSAPTSVNPLSLHHTLFATLTIITGALTSLIFYLIFKL